jgi:hypothetical protein
VCCLVVGRVRQENEGDDQEFVRRGSDKAPKTCSLCTLTSHFGNMNKLAHLAWLLLIGGGAAWSPAPRARAIAPPRHREACRHFVMRTAPEVATRARLPVPQSTTATATATAATAMSALVLHPATAWAEAAASDVSSDVGELPPPIFVIVFAVALLGAIAALQLSLGDVVSCPRQRDPRQSLTNRSRGSLRRLKCRHGHDVCRHQQSFCHRVENGREDREDERAVEVTSVCRADSP